MPFDVAGARKAGASDDEILEHLTASRKFDVAGALRAGASKGDIIDHLSGAPPVDQGARYDSHRDSFMEESGLKGLGALGDRLANSGHTINPGDIGGILKDMYQGQATETGQELGKAGEAFGQGNIGGALAHFIGGTPIIGHPLLHAAENTTSGNLPGLAGDLLSLFGPQAAKLVGEGASGAARNAGLNFYRRQLPFDSAAMSPTEMENTVRYGVDQALPAQNLFAPAGKRTLDRLGDTGKPGTLMGDLEAKTRPFVTGTNGAQKVNMETALGPFLAKLNKRLEAPTATGGQMASAMLTEAQPALEKMDPVMRHVFDPDAKGKGVPFSAAEKTQLIEAWSKGNSNALDVSDAHIDKRRIYDTLNDSMFKDNNGSVPAGAKETNLSLAQGYKNAVNEIHPQMIGINDQMHNAINLSDALREAAKASPKEFSILAKLAVGGGLGAMGAGGAAMGAMHGGELMSGAGAGLAGVLAMEALKSPRIATQLGIVLGKRFPAVAHAVAPFVNAADYAGDALSQVSRPLGDKPVK